MLKLGISYPIASFSNFISSAYDSTALNCGNFAFTLSGLPRRSQTQGGARKSKPTCASVSIAVSLKESPGPRAVLTTPSTPDKLSP